MEHEKYAGNSTTPDEDKLLKYLKTSDARKLSAKIRERNLLKWPEMRQRLSSTIDDFVNAIKAGSETVIPPHETNDERQNQLRKEMAEIFRKVDEELAAAEPEIQPTDEELLKLLEVTLLKIDEEIADLKNAT